MNTLKLGFLSIFSIIERVTNYKTRSVCVKIKKENWLKSLFLFLNWIKSSKLLSNITKNKFMKLKIWIQRLMTLKNTLIQLLMIRLICYIELLLMLCKHQKKGLDLRGPTYKPHKTKLMRNILTIQVFNY